MRSIVQALARDFKLLINSRFALVFVFNGAITALLNDAAAVGSSNIRTF
jgi:hypothetical protein